jgi:23S rRNA (uridine2552-2'-O)-methyltransferase
MPLNMRRFFSTSSHQWIQRQLNDTFVKRAQEENFRNRAAFKLVQLDDKYSFFRKNKNVLDLGCYSGGWSQVALQLRIEPLPDPHIFIQGDINDTEMHLKVIESLGGGRVDVVLSDMSPSTSGSSLDDHLAMTDLNLKACELMERVIAMKGWFILKTFTGPETMKLRTYLNSRFDTVLGHKPEASRKESSEIFLVCAKFKGRDKISSEVASNFRYKSEGEERQPHDKHRPRTPQSVEGQRLQEDILAQREKTRKD